MQQIKQKRDNQERGTGNLSSVFKENTPLRYLQEFGNNNNKDLILQP